MNSVGDNMSRDGMKPKIIFFGNGMLADYALAVLERECQVIFHARTREDIEEACRLKRECPDAIGVLASFGVIIKEPVLEAFEPEGILNIHPSLLPKYRGASPIESAILAGDTDFGVSIMKLARAMDAGPIYHQVNIPALPLDKATIYKRLAETGAEWIAMHLTDLPVPISQDESKATFTAKLDKSMSKLTPETDTAEQTFRKIVAYQGYPKPKYTFYGVSCIILEAHVAKVGETAVLTIPCADGHSVVVTRVQPEGRKAMDAKAFMNGYAKNSSR
ncbi:methionyl-tRNA formyltransferase [Candidatus Saccharibacteria bacterium]|nr:methionyl-tRNA formyltransferase [Candidatus Saccharibacteria bacterium]